MADIQTIVNKQREFFYNGNTLPIQTRIKYLQSLKNQLIIQQDEIALAIKSDLNKSAFECYITETSMVLSEINYMLKHIKKLSRPRNTSTSILNFPSSGKIYQEAYGIVLIMSPWNYPLQLALTPLVGAIAAGNCAIVKPSNYSSATSNIITKIIENVFPPEYVSVIQGGRDVNQTLLDTKFDFIFFTGGITVGKLVMKKAAEFITPVVLELGGKSPCIVDETANLQIAAKRIIWGKSLNSGQTCVAPDYLLVQKSVHDKLIELLKEQATQMLTSSPSTNSQFPKIINQKHFERLISLIDNAKSKVIYGGKANPETRQIDLTLFDNVTFSDEIMQDEIFGPILPILTFDTIDDVVSSVNARPKPLALYFFTSSKSNQQKIMQKVSFGGGCINDTIVHLANDNLPFGGVGESGMGSYHGKQSFKTFSHAKTVLKKSCLIDLAVRYPPYDEKNIKTIQKLI